MLGSSETVYNGYKYLGKYGVIADSDSHLYIRARYYSPELGRFTQIDILKGNITNPLSLNRYRYTDGSPINYIDVNGREAYLLIDTEGAGGNGHAAVIIKDSVSGKFKYYSWATDGSNDSGSGGNIGLLVDDVRGVMEEQTYNKISDIPQKYDKFIYFATDNKQDNKMLKEAEKYLKFNDDKDNEEYDLTSNNCGDVAEAILESGVDFDLQDSLILIKPNSIIGDFEKTLKNQEKLDYELLDDRKSFDSHTPKKRKE